MHLSCCAAAMPPKRCAEDREVLDLSGLSEEWDRAEDIRSRLRDGESLVTSAVNTDVVGCAKYNSLLSPIVIRMATLETKPLPNLEPLREHIEKVLFKNKRDGKGVEADEVVRCSWKIKQMCGFVKMKARRHEVSTAP